MTLTWLLLAAALALVAPVRAPDGDVADVRSTRALSPRTLRCGAGAAVAAACVAAWGVVPGVPVAVLAGPLVTISIGWLQAHAQPTRADSSLALALDLIAVALRSGQSLAVSLTVAAPAADGESARRLDEVGGLLRLGAAPAQAWRAVAQDPVLSQVAAAAVRSAASGVRLANAFEQLAAELRAELRVAAQARAHRVGVLAAAPLGLCFLPAFVCVGIVPLVVGVAGAALANA